MDNEIKNDKDNQNLMLIRLLNNNNSFFKWKRHKNQRKMEIIMIKWLING